MKKCIECLHYEVCKYKDQEICRGSTVEDTLHECKDFKSKEKFFSKQISNVVINELGFNRTVVEDIIRGYVENRNIEALVEHSVNKYIHDKISWHERSPEGTYFSTDVQKRIINLVDKEVQKRIRGKVSEEMDKIVETEVSRILANVNNETTGDDND